MKTSQESLEIRQSTLQQFMVDNWDDLDTLASSKHVASVSLLFTHELDHSATITTLFKPLLMIIEPGKGFTIAHQDAFFDGVNKLAGQLLGHIMVCSLADLESFKQRGYLNTQELQWVLESKKSLEDYCPRPSIRH
jgi:hypothetical protein